MLSVAVSYLVLTVILEAIVYLIFGRDLSVILAASLVNTVTWPIAQVLFTGSWLSYVAVESGVIVSECLVIGLMYSNKDACISVFANVVSAGFGIGLVGF